MWSRILFLLCIITPVLCDLTSVDDLSSIYRTSIKIEYLESLQKEGPSDGDFIKTQLSKQRLDFKNLLRQHGLSISTNIADVVKASEQRLAQQNASGFFEIDFGKLAGRVALASIFFTALSLAFHYFGDIIIHRMEHLLSASLWICCVSCFPLASLLPTFWSTPIMLVNCAVFPVALLRSSKMNESYNIYPYVFTVFGYYFFVTLLHNSSILGLLAVGVIAGTVLRAVGKRVRAEQFLFFTPVGVLFLFIYIFNELFLWGKFQLFDLGLLWTGGLIFYGTILLSTTSYTSRMSPKGYYIFNTAAMLGHVALIYIGLLFPALRSLRLFTCASFVALWLLKYIDVVLFSNMTRWVLLLNAVIIYLVSPYLSQLFYWMTQ
ncbi:hypothetical protein PROFUN_01247 [Planoprotostelium fungivorum]|uniref:Uncharacterized protein n=1 Tax=Planoprotostelium fungivorum TaxID=1890364 RepID=A0A2P6NZK7_9EUKA|nr:hypothetical protein PROFUN_01247 [Planoprotostelium fungivorum]